MLESPGSPSSAPQNEVRKANTVSSSITGWYRHRHFCRGCRLVAQEQRSWRMDREHASGCSRDVHTGVLAVHRLSCARDWAFRRRRLGYDPVVHNRILGHSWVNCWGFSQVVDRAAAQSALINGQGDLCPPPPAFLISTFQFPPPPCSASATATTPNDRRPPASEGRTSRIPPSLTASSISVDQRFPSHPISLQCPRDT